MVFFVDQRLSNSKELLEELKMAMDLNFGEASVEEN
jgi:hypothetical protein